MRKKGLVYAGVASEEDLKKLLSSLEAKTLHLCWDLLGIRMGEGIPEEPGETGTAFNGSCEIRWQRAERVFQVLILSDTPMDPKGFRKVGGEWETEEVDTQLVPLDAPQFSPHFERYPVVESGKAKLRCRIFYRNGVATFLSPREVLPDES